MTEFIVPNKDYLSTLIGRRAQQGICAAESAQRPRKKYCFWLGAQGTLEAARNRRRVAEANDRIAHSARMRDAKVRSTKAAMRRPMCHFHLLPSGPYAQCNTPTMACRLSTDSVATGHPATCVLLVLVAIPRASFKRSCPLEHTDKSDASMIPIKPSKIVAQKPITALKRHTRAVDL